MSDAAAQAAAQEAAIAAARQATITLWTLYAFGVLVTVLRTYARVVAVGFTKLRGDDYLAWVALVSFGALDSAALVLTLHAASLFDPGAPGIRNRQHGPRSRQQWHDGRPASSTVP
jgi:hypothetical protein